MVVVTAASGNIGRQLVTELARLNQDVRAVFHGTRPVSSPRPGQVEWVEGDLNEERGLSIALAGAERMFLLSPGPDIPLQDHNGIEAAREAGIRQVVLLSSGGVLDGTGSGPAHIPGERELISSGLSWTILRPAAFMSNALLQWLPTIKANSAFYQPTGDGKHPSIHPLDVAAVAAKVLTSTGHNDKIYQLTGPESLSAREQAETLSMVLGRRIEYVDVPEDVFKAQLLRALPPGFPDAVLAAILKFYAVVKAGQSATISPTVEQLLGRRARTFEEWARENAARFV